MVRCPTCGRQRRGPQLTALRLLVAHFLGDAKNITQWLGVRENSRSLRKIPGLFAASSGLLPVCDSNWIGRWRCHQYCQQDHVDDADWNDCDGDNTGCGINYQLGCCRPYFKQLWETIGPYFEAGWELLKKVLPGRRWGW